MPIRNTAVGRKGKPRDERNCKVIALPTGPEESDQSLRLLFEGSRKECEAYYESIRQSGNPNPSAMALIDGMDRPIYACSY